MRPHPAGAVPVFRFEVLRGNKVNSAYKGKRKNSQEADSDGSCQDGQNNSAKAALGAAIEKTVTIRAGRAPGRSAYARDPAAE